MQGASASVETEAVQEFESLATSPCARSSTGFHRRIAHPHGGGVRPIYALINNAGYVSGSLIAKPIGLSAERTRTWLAVFSGESTNPFSIKVKRMNLPLENKLALVTGRRAGKAKRVNSAGFSLSVLVLVPLFSGVKWVKRNRTFARVQQADHPEHASYGQRPKHGTEDTGDHARNQGHVHQGQEHAGNKSQERPQRKVQDVSQEGRLLPEVFGQPLFGRKGLFWSFGSHGFFLRLGGCLYCIRRSRMMLSDR
jgi:hypothetical protein